MLKKLLVSTVIAAPISPIFADQAEIRNIDELRDLCQSLEQNEQVRMFNKGVLCRSSQSIWQKRVSQLELMNKASFDAAASYEKSDSPKSTKGDHSDVLASSNHAQCNVYEQFEVVAPQMPVFVNSCDELTSENVERLCREAVTEQCFAPSSVALEPSSNDTQGQQSACSSTKIAEFNTCKLYDDSGCQGNACSQPTDSAMDRELDTSTSSSTSSSMSTTSSTSSLTSMSLK